MRPRMILLSRRNTPIRIDMRKILHVFLPALYFLLPAAIGAGFQAAPPLGAAEWRKAIREVVDSELAFARAAAEKGTRGAFLIYLAQDVRFLRADRQPVVGASQAREMLAGEKGSWKCHPQKWECSVSGDLGYTYGTLDIRLPGNSDIESQSGYYVRIWKNQPSGEWKIVFDMFLAQ